MADWTQVHATPPLSEEERRVLLEAATEPPFSGRYDDFWENGLYLCRQCGAPLYGSAMKFDCGCGWAAFDDALGESVGRRPDPDGVRTEIFCANCGGHLGHVFLGEGLTPKDTRHCVNSLSLLFVPTERAVVAGGCFWGVEELFRHMRGVLFVQSGYTGGNTENPTYKEVCTDRTGHAEAVEIYFDPTRVSYRSVLRLFFEIHDPTQVNRQGPDVGTQYRSAVFCLDEAQRETAAETIAFLKSKGLEVATELLPAAPFHPAEEYHQKYFAKHPDRLVHTCHIRQEIDWGD